MIPKRSFIVTFSKCRAALAVVCQLEHSWTSTLSWGSEGIFPSPLDFFFLREGQYLLFLSLTFFFGFLFSLTIKKVGKTSIGDKIFFLYLLRVFGWA